MLQKPIFGLMTGIWRASLLYRGHWVLILTCLFAACLPILFLAVLKSSFPVSEEPETCASPPKRLLSSGIHPFLEEIVCGVTESDCHSADGEPNSGLSSLPLITERFPTDDELLDFMRDRNPASVLKKLTKTIGGLGKFAKNLKRKPTLHDLIHTPFSLVKSVTNYERLVAVAKERLNMNVSEATATLLEKISLKQIFSGIPKHFLEYTLFEPRTLKEFLTLPDDLAVELYKNSSNFNYDNVKFIYKAVYDHLDWRKIYLKVNQLRSYYLETQLTPKHLESIREMIESFSEIENLRSLLGIVYSSKISLETFAETRKVLSDTGWTHREIEELLAFFLELNEEGILEKYFQLSSQKRSSKEDSLFYPLTLYLLRNNRINFLKVTGNCTNHHIVELPQKAKKILSFLKELLKLSSEIQVTKENLTFAEVLRKLDFSLQVVELNEQGNEELFDACESGQIIWEIVQNLKLVNFETFTYDLINYISSETTEDASKKIVQIASKLFKTVFLNKNNDNYDREVFHRMNNLIKYATSIADQFVSTAMKIFPDTSGNSNKSNFLQQLIDHPILSLNPENVVRVMGDLLTTNLAHYLLGHRSSQHEDCSINSPARNLTADIRCSFKDGFIQSFSSPFFDELFHIKPGSESPSSHDLLRNSLLFSGSVRKANSMGKIPLYEVQQFVEIWSSKSQWENLEESLNIYHKKWIYSFMDTFIPLWNKPISRMLRKTTDLAVFVETFIEEFQNFIDSEQIMMSEILNQLMQRNDTTWKTGLQIVYFNILELGEVLRYDDICGSESKLVAVENITIAHFEESIKLLCSISLKPVADALRQFDKSVDKKLREKVLPTGTLHFKSLVEHWQRAFEKWTNLLKVLDNHDAMRLVRFLLNDSHKLMKLSDLDGEYASSSSKTNLLFIQSMFEFLQIDKSPSKIPKKFSPEFLHKTSMLRQLFATDAEDLLQGTPELFNLQDIALNVIPQAMREVVVFVTTKPRMVSFLYSFIIQNATVCNIDLSLMGESAGKVQRYFCNIPTDTLTYEIEKLMSPNAYKKNFQEKTNSAILKLIDQTMTNLQRKVDVTTDTAYAEEANISSKIFNFSKWNKIFDTILNVTVDEIYDNGAMIWSQTVSPLVKESRSGKPKSEKLRIILVTFERYLRQAKLILGFLAGGDLWTSFKNGYEDKNYIVQLIDYLEKSPQIITHVLEYYGNHPKLLYELVKLKDFQNFCSILAKLSEERSFDEPDEWKEFFKFICTKESRDLILSQLNPKELPVIGNLTVMDSDAAVLGLLLDGVSWDLFLLQRKYFFEGNIQVPDWLRPYHWTKAKELFLRILERSMSDQLTLSLLVKENKSFRLATLESSSRFNPFAKWKKIMEVIGSWINELEDSGNETSIIENINVDNLVLLVVQMSESEVLHQYLVGDSMEDILKYTCHKQNLSNASLFMCSLIRVCYFDLYDLPLEEDDIEEKQETDYNIFSEKINAILEEISDFNVSHDTVQERFYRIFKILVFVRQQLYVASCQDVEECILQMKLLKGLMSYVVYLDENPLISNISFDIVKDAMNRILKPITTKNKGGKWANSEEELLEASRAIYQIFDEFAVSFIRIFKVIMKQQSDQNVSTTFIKLHGFLETVSEISWRLSSENSLRNLLVEFGYEIDANEKALTLLIQMVNDKRTPTANKNGYQIMRQILTRKMPIKILNNSTEELDTIITALLFFNEAVDVALFKELLSANFSVTKISEGKQFVLRSLRESSGEMLRLSKEYIPGSLLQGHLHNIKNGLDILLQTEEPTESLKNNVLKDLINKEVDLRRKLKILRVPDTLVQGILTAVVDLNKFQVVVDKWYHSISATCEQIATPKNSTTTERKFASNNNSKVAVICNKLRNIDFPLILLSQLNISSIFFQVENFTLHEIINSSKESLTSIQDSYVQSYYLSEHLLQIKDLFLSLTKLWPVDGHHYTSDDMKNNGTAINMQILQNFRSQICSNIKSDSEINEYGRKEVDGDLCSSLVSGSTNVSLIRSERLFNGKILIMPKNQLTRTLMDLMSRSFGENVEKSLFLLQNISRFLTEDCKDSLQDILRDLQLEIQQHDWAHSLVQTVLAIDLNQINIVSHNILQFCETIRNGKQEFQILIDFVQKFIHCFKRKRFNLISLSDFEKNTEALMGENNILAGIDFSEVSRLDPQGVPESVNYILKLPLNRSNSSAVNLNKRLWISENGSVSGSKRIQKEIAILQNMIENSLTKLFSTWQYSPKKHGGKNPSSNNFTNISSPSVGFVQSIRNKRQTSFDELVDNHDIPVYGVDTSFGCHVQNQKYYDSVINSPTMGAIICCTTFILYGILLITTFIDEAKSMDHELRRVYSVNSMTSFSFPMMFSALVLIALACFLPLLLKYLSVLPQTSLLITMALFFLFGANLIIISHTISVIFVSKISAVVSFLAVVSVMAFIYTLILALEKNTTHPVLILGNLFPVVGFCFALRSLHQYEKLGIGASYSNLWILPTDENEISLAFVLLLQLASFALFSFLDLLVVLLYKKDSVLYSGDKFLNFKVGHQNVPEISSRTSNNETFAIFQEQSHPKTNVHPTLSGSFKRSLKVVGLQKLIYDQRKTIIIGENISFEAYEDQIFVIYGPRKSGKTTVISMIAGIIPPSSGHVSVYGEVQKTVKENLKKIVSFCPKESAILPFVTVKECLVFYGYLKAIKNYEQVRDEAESLIIDLKLEKWQNIHLKDVPKGIQKYVAVASALIGGSKVIALDEPSWQIPYSLKRNLFNVLSKYRKDRTILITTEDTEITEHLADVISVMDRGKLLFIGSKKVLMEEFSPGYEVIIHNRQDSMPLPNQEEREDKIEELFQEYLPNASFMDFDNGGEEIKFNIPYLVVQLHPESFCYLLRDLEMKKEELGLSFVDVVHPTMAMILKAVLQQGETFRQEALLTPEREEIHKRNFSFTNSTTLSVFKQSALVFGALLNKRMLHNIRQKKLYLQILLVPLLLIVLSMFCLWIPPNSISRKALDVSSSYINNGIYLLPHFIASSLENEEDQSGFEDFLLRRVEEEEEEGRLLDDEPCDEEKIQNHFLVLKNTTCSHNRKPISYISCICRQNRCIMKRSISKTHFALIPFNKRHFRVIPKYMAEEQNPPSSKGIHLHFDQMDVTSLPLMVNSLSRFRGLEASSSWRNSSITSSVEFISSSKLSCKKFSQGHHLSLTILSLLLLAAIVIGTVSSSLQMVGEKGQWSVMKAAGVSKVLYLSSFVAWDSLVVLILVFLMATTAAIFYDPNLVAGSNLAALSLLAIFYGFSLLPISYVVHNFFREEEMAVKIVCCFHIGIAVLTSYTSYFCIEFSDLEAINIVGNYLDKIFFFFPPFVFVSGVKTIYFIYIQNQQQILAESEISNSPFTWSSSTDLHIGVHLVVLGNWIFVGYFSLLLLESQNCILSYWKKILKKDNEIIDEDPPFINCMTSMNATNLSYNMAYSMKRTNLSLYVCKGECLMIVGEDAAENTMLLRHLTGELKPLSGTITKPNDAMGVDDSVSSRNFVSYCPRVPALDEFLTTEEEMQIFSQLRGFWGSDLCETVHRALCTFNLISVKNFKTKDLSLETKRRISLAKASIGNPKILILDDPFTDSSLKFRKLVQELISSVVDAFDSVIFTSLSLDNLSKLTTRLAFFEDGNIVKMGKTSKLQSSLRGKYLTKIQLGKLEDMKAVQKLLEEGVEGLQITEKYHNSMEAQFSCDMTPFSVFGVIAKVKMTTPLWYELSSLNLAQYSRAESLPISRESSPDRESAVVVSLLNMSYGSISTSGMAFPVFDIRKARDNSFYDNKKNDDPFLQNKFNLSARGRRGSHGSGKLTPCTTPQPPRSPTAYRSSLETLSPLEHRRSTDCRSSADPRSSTDKSITAESPFILRKPRKIKRRAELPLDKIYFDMQRPSCSYHSEFEENDEVMEPGGVSPSHGASSTPNNLLTSEASGSQHLMEKFLENLPTVQKKSDARTLDVDENITQF